MVLYNQLNLPSLPRVTHDTHVCNLISSTITSRLSSTSSKQFDWEIKPLANSINNELVVDDYNGIIVI